MIKLMWKIGQTCQESVPAFWLEQLSGWWCHCKMGEKRSGFVSGKTGSKYSKFGAPERPEHCGLLLRRKA